jgi:hypothetical protein
MKKNIGRERHDDYHPEKIRKDQKTSSREAGEIIVGNGNRCVIGHQQTDAAQGGERGQGHDEGGQPEFADPESMKRTNREPKEQRQNDGSQMGKPFVSNIAIRAMPSPMASFSFRISTGWPSQKI